MSLINFRTRKKDKNQRGVAALEFALAMPIWVMLLLGCADGGYCALINQRIDRVSYTITDLVTQQESLTNADLNNIFLAAGELMQPYQFTDQGFIIVSSVYKSPTTGTTKILWQRSGAGTYNCSSVSTGCSSRIGVTGQTPVMPGDMTLNNNDNVIVVEVFYRFTPLFLSANLFSSQDIYRVAVYKPRLSTLTATPS